jgi:hypothetical protein
MKETQKQFVALVVDRGGVLDVASLDLSTQAGWHGLETIGASTLVPGSPVSVLKESDTQFAALVVDRSGVLNVASLDLSTQAGWQGLETIGASTLVPGSPVSVLKVSDTQFAALVVDRSGVLNVASLDLSTQAGWHGLETIGSNTLVPGSPVAVLKETDTQFFALVVDRNGVLNAASLDLSTQDGWQGLETIGASTIVPGSSIASV